LEDSTKKNHVSSFLETNLGSERRTREMRPCNYCSDSRACIDPLQRRTDDGSGGIIANNCEEQYKPCPRSLPPSMRRPTRSTPRIEMLRAWPMFSPSRQPLWEAVRCGARWLRLVCGCGARGGGGRWCEFLTCHNDIFVLRALIGRQASRVTQVRRGLILCFFRQCV
jgi:hypothetical protein